MENINKKISKTEIISIRADGLHVQIQGAGSPLLMIHGIISDCRFFDESAELLAKEYQVIRYDRRGYGESNLKKYTDFSVETQKQDLISVIKKTCREPVWILGNSAGGLIALALAMSNPELIRGMVLLEPSLGYDADEQKKLSEWNRELNGYVEANRIKRALPAFGRVVGQADEQKRKGSMEEMKRTLLNLENFMYGELDAIQSFLPPEDVLKALPMPVIIAAGQAGREEMFASASLDAAKRLDWPVLWLPGYHNTVKDHPAEFAHAFHETIQHYDRITAADS